MPGDEFPLESIGRSTSNRANTECVGECRDAARPYYRCHLAADAPRLPAGYVLLMFAAFVPALWNRVMMPALERWRTQPMAPLSAGRRIACVALYKRVRA
jgi:hypothetical protein